MDKKNVWDDVWSKEKKVIYPNPIVIHTIINLDIKSVIELGGGSGNDIIELNNKGLEVVYSDNSSVAISNFNKKTDNKIKAVKLNVLDRFPFPDNFFDLVYSLGLLEHFNKNQREQIIKEMFRISKKYVLVDVPKKYSFLTLVKKALMSTGRWKYGWETEFSYNQLVKECMDVTNCKPLKTYCRGFLPLPRRFKEKFSHGFFNIGMNSLFLDLQRNYNVPILFNCMGILFKKMSSKK